MDGKQRSCCCFLSAGLQYCSCPMMHRHQTYCFGPHRRADCGEGASFEQVAKIHRSLVPEKRATGTLQGLNTERKRKYSGSLLDANGGWGVFCACKIAVAPSESGVCPNSPHIRLRNPGVESMSTLHDSICQQSLWRGQHCCFAA